MSFLSKFGVPSLTSRLLKESWQGRSKRNFTTYGTWTSQYSFLSDGLLSRFSRLSSRAVPNCFCITQEREFASSRRRQSQKGKKETKPLANEDLISFVMRKHGKTPPHKVKVRLVIDEGQDKPATVSVVSLADAIEVSVDRMTDLIGTSLDSDPPVIRATALSKLEYRQQQTQQKGNAKSKKQTKSFRFRSGISDHDLERKLGDMIKSLEKGLECDFSVFSRARRLHQNPNIGFELVERIQLLVAEFGQPKGKPQVNESGTFARVKLMPKKKKG